MGFCQSFTLQKMCRYTLLLNWRANTQQGFENILTITHVYISPTYSYKYIIILAYDLI